MTDASRHGYQLLSYQVNVSSRSVSRPLTPSAYGPSEMEDCEWLSVVLSGTMCIPHTIDGYSGICLADACIELYKDHQNKFPPA